MDVSTDRRSRLDSPLAPGRFTKVSVETNAGELEARLSEYGNWEVRVRRGDEPNWRHACAGDLCSGSQTMLPVVPKSEETIVRGPLVVDASARRVTVSDSEVRLAQKEFALLLALAQDPERVWSKAQLLKSVWGYDETSRTRTLDSHASRLRLKLDRAGAKSMVVNVWGVGYKLWDRLDPETFPALAAVAHPA